MALVKGDIIHFEFPDYVPVQWVIKGPHYAVVLYDSVTKEINTVTVVPITSVIDHETGQRRKLKSWHMELDNKKYNLSCESYLKTDQIQTIDRDKIRFCSEKLPLDTDDLAELDLKIVEVFEMYSALDYYAINKLKLIYDAFFNEQDDNTFNRLRAKVETDVIDPLESNFKDFADSLSVNDDIKGELKDYFGSQKDEVTINTIRLVKDILGANKKN